MAGTFSIGEWRVDPSLRTLSSVKGEVHLEPKHMQVLTVLAEHAGQVVSKQRLLQTVWADTFVGDEALSKTISELRRALGDDPKAPRFIQTIPKGGYRLVSVVTFGQSPHDELGPSPANASELGPAAPVPLRPLWFRRSMLVAALLILLAAFGTLVLLGVRHFAGDSSGRVLRASGSVTQLTTQTGLEFDPAFSPDGTQLVYSRMSEGCPFQNCGPSSQASGLWQTVVGSNDERQLTTGPGLDVSARFSPDGRQVAFVRREDALNRRRIMLVSAVGGPSTKLSEFPAAAAAITWSADGTAIIAGRDPVDSPNGDRGLYAVPLTGGAPRAITQATPPMMHVDPALSPDGHRLAFVACRYTGLMPYDCDIAVADITSDLRMTSPPRRLVTMATISGPVWDIDGKSVIFVGDPDGSQIWSLWKLAADGQGALQRLESAGRDLGEHLAMARGGGLAFSRIESDSDILRIAIGQPPVTLISSSMFEGGGTYSEERRRIAFVSDRSGAMAIWVAEADGSAPRQLTHGPNGHGGSPKFSPDGKRIAFDSQFADGHWRIRIIDAEGGAATQLTFGPEDQNIPFWSRDGQWVYYASGHGQGIARVPARGGAPEPIVTGGSGLVASESTDGRSILFQPKEGDSPLLERALSGGPVRQVLPCVQAGAFAVHAKGIYYIPCGAGPDPVVHLLGASDHRDRPFFSLKAYDGYAGWPLSVSPDGNAMLYTTTVSMRGDLWMIENLR
jgi:Tol biopolymer transport system component/DNA-binding winged helix-turn-helix (wHTH) protein